MTRTSKKQQLFDLGAKSLRGFGINEELFLCPICCKCFGRDSLMDGTLTLEDVPPRSIGGKGIILTCKTCNSLAGAKYDHQFKAERDFRSALKSIATGRFEGGGSVKLSFDDLRVNAKIAEEGGKAIVATSVDHNSPTNYEHFLSKVKDSWPKSEIILTFSNGLSKTKLNLARLKSAYLLAGSLFGYTYMLGENCALIRAQLLHPGRPIFTLPEAKTTESVPNGIVVDLERGLVFISYLGGVFILPWVGIGHDKFIGLIHKVGVEMISGDFFELPTTFQGILDRQPNRFGFRVEIELTNSNS